MASDTQTDTGHAHGLSRSLEAMEGVVAARRRRRRARTPAVRAGSIRACWLR